jgi:hypothetical protein
VKATGYRHFCILFPVNKPTWIKQKNQQPTPNCSPFFSGDDGFMNRLPIPPMAR